ncbi:MAG TPA: GNAT family N-acetyltransferase [Ramlibacter sp.]|nr:GNAT family N-acetyltransferase [Ramlibacter sp.]
MLAGTVIRLATPDDAAGIAALSREAIEHGLPWSWQPPRVARAIRSRDTNVVVVGPSHAIEAFGIMSYLEDDAHLLLFAVHPGRRRQGLGSRVLAWLEDVARAAGATRIRVEARRDNDAARSFYNEHGYHETGLAPAMYSGLLDGVRLEKWLRAPE